MPGTSERKQGIDCPLCGSAMEPGEEKCGNCGAVMKSHERDRPLSGLYTKGPAVFLRFLFIFVLVDFLITFFANLNEPEALTYLAPHVVEMADIRWMFVGLLMAGADAYLHEMEKRWALSVSVILTCVMLVGQAQLVFPGGEYADWLPSSAFFIVLTLLVYLDLVHVYEWTDRPGLAEDTVVREPVQAASERLRPDIASEAETLLRLGRYEEARSRLEVDIAAHGESSRLWLLKGRALVGMGHIGDGVKALQNCIDVDPDSVEGLYWLGRALMKVGKENEALRSVNHGLKKDKTHSPSWELAGDILSQKERYEEALRCYDKAVEADGTNYTAWTRKGELLYHFALQADEGGEELEEHLIEETLDLAGEPVLKRSEVDLNLMARKRTMREEKPGTRKMVRSETEARAEAEVAAVLEMEPDAETEVEETAEDPVAQAFLAAAGAAPAAEPTEPVVKDAPPPLKPKDVTQASLEQVLLESIHYIDEEPEEEVDEGEEEEGEEEHVADATEEERLPSEEDIREMDRKALQTVAYAFEEELGIKINKNQKTEALRGQLLELSGDVMGAAYDEDETNVIADLLAQEMGIVSGSEDVPLEDDGGEPVLCPLCDKPITTGNSRCENCGAKIVYYCPACNGEIDPSEKRCSGCGSEFEIG